jgi:hypothetical protein
MPSFLAHFGFLSNGNVGRLEESANGLYGTVDYRDAGIPSFTQKQKQRVAQEGEAPASSILTARC